MPWLLPKICIIIQNSHVKLVQKYSLLFQFSGTIQDKDPSSIQYLAQKWRAIFGPVVAVLIGALVGHLWHADSCR